MNIPSFNEIKTTQTAAYLLQLNGGRLSYMKLIKLIYNANREALRRWKRPITFDLLYSMPFGQVPSTTLNLANGENQNAPYWMANIKKSGRDSVLISNLDIDELSKADMTLLSEIDEKHKHSSKYDMADEHHDPSKFPEWVNPLGSHILTEYETLLTYLDYSEDEINQIASDLGELAIIRSI